MAAHVGILSPVIAAPSGSFLSRSTKKRSREVSTLTAHDGTGQTKKAAAHALITHNVSISGKGAASLSLVSSGAIVSGTVKITSVKQEEMNTDFPGFDIEGVTYS